MVHVGGSGRIREVRGREPEEWRSTGESERGPGGGVALRETSRGRRRQPGREEVAGVWLRAPGTRPLPTGTRRKATGGGAWWAGPHSYSAGPVVLQVSAR